MGNRTSKHPRKRINSYDQDAPVPIVGSKWTWEPNKPHARVGIVVVEVKWNGEELWVTTRSDDGTIAFNDIGRFWEAVDDV